MANKRILLIAAVVLSCMAAGNLIGNQVKASEAEEMVKENNMDLTEEGQKESEEIKEIWIAQEAQKNQETPVIVENKEQIGDLITEPQLEELTVQLRSYLKENKIPSRFINLPRETIVWDSAGNLAFVCQFPQTEETKEPDIKGSFLTHMGKYSFEHQQE